MNDMTEIIEHLRAARPHMKAMGDALERHAVPDVPQMIVAAQRKAKQLGRLDELVGIAEFIGTASLLECNMVIAELIDRVSTLTGCACELEDASHSISRELQQGDD